MSSIVYLEGQEPLLLNDRQSGEVMTGATGTFDICSYNVAESQVIVSSTGATTISTDSSLIPASNTVFAWELYNGFGKLIRRRYAKDGVAAITWADNAFGSYTVTNDDFDSSNNTWVYKLWYHPTTPEFNDVSATNVVDHGIPNGWCIIGGAASNKALVKLNEA